MDAVVTLFEFSCCAVHLICLFSHLFNLIHSFAVWEFNFRSSYHTHKCTIAAEATLTSVIVCDALEISIEIEL